MKPYFEEDGITIYHGDCRDVLPGKVGDALVTDPPYGMNDKIDRSTRVGQGKLHSGVLTRPSWGTVIYGDDEPFDPRPWLKFPKVVLFGAVHYSPQLPMSRAWLVWDKREGTTSDDGADCDFAWTNLPGPARLYHQLWRGVCRAGNENGESLLHPHQKPIGLMKWVLLQCKLGAAATIVDPYVGSGSTLVAAKSMGLRAIGIEIEEKYCEIAAKRLAQKVLSFQAYR
jgi:site-specific DNA-methyltransferase (adenine-specific)